MIIHFQYTNYCLLPIKNLCHLHQHLNWIPFWNHLYIQLYFLIEFNYNLQEYVIRCADINFLLLSFLLKLNTSPWLRIIIKFHHFNRAFKWCIQNVEVENMKIFFSQKWIFFFSRVFFFVKNVYHWINLLGVDGFEFVSQHSLQGPHKFNENKNIKIYSRNKKKVHKVTHKSFTTRSVVNVGGGISFAFN